MREFQDKHNAPRLLQLIADTLILIDQKGICQDIYINSNLWFIKEEFLLNKNIFELLPRHTLFKLYPVFQKVIREQIKIEKNFRLELPDATYYFKCIMQPYDDMVLCQYRDITHRSNVKLKLERVNHELKEIQKVAHIGQWQYSTADYIINYSGLINIIGTDIICSIHVDHYINEFVVEEDQLIFREWLKSNIKKNNIDNLGFRIKYAGKEH